MRNLRGKAAVLVGVAALALLALIVLAIVQGRYDTLLVGVIASAGVLLIAVRTGTSPALQRSVDKLTKQTAGIARVAEGVARLEDTVTATPTMLEGSQERQLAETAARFDWLARRHTEDAERQAALRQELAETFARQHAELLALLQNRQAGADTAGPSEPGTSGTAGPGR